MTDIAKYRGTSNRIMVGPGSATRLTAKVMPAVWFERSMDPFTWNTQIFRMNEGIIAAANFQTVDAGTGTETHTLVATGWTLGTSATDNDNCIITMDVQDTSMGVSGFWDTDKEPFMMVRLLAGVQDAGAMLDTGIIAGFDDVTTVANSDPELSTAANCFRWQSTVGAAAGGTWKCETSVAGADAVFDSGVAVQRATFVDLCVLLSKARKPHYYINGNLVNVGPSLAAADELVPKLVIENDASDAKTMGIQFWALGQRHVARA